MADLLFRTATDMLRPGELAVDPTTKMLFRGDGTTAGGRAIMDGEGRLNLANRDLRLHTGLISITAGSPWLRKYGTTIPPAAGGGTESSHDCVNTTALLAGTPDGLAADTCRITFPVGGYVVTGWVIPHGSAMGGSAGMVYLYPHIVGIGVGSIDFKLRSMGSFAGRLYYNGSAWVHSGIVPAMISATWDTGGASPNTHRIRLVHQNLFGGDVTDRAICVPSNYDSHIPRAINTSSVRTDVSFFDRTTGAIVTTEDTKMDCTIYRHNNAFVPDVRGATVTGTWMFFALTTLNTNSVE